MRLWMVLACLFLITGSLAGCVGGSDDVETQVPPEEPDDGDPGVDGSSGAISGTVASALFEPLDAEVLLWDQERTEVLEETVAQEGKFTFRELAPATYAVQAVHPGYTSEYRGAKVEAGAVARVEFQLEVVPSDDPYLIEEETRGIVHTYSYRVEPPAAGCVSQPVPGGSSLPLVPGSISNCGGGFIPFVPWENARGTLDMIDDETHTIIVEMFWESAGALGENLNLVLFCDAANSTEDPCYHRATQMTSPNQIRVDKEHAEENDYKMAQTWRWFVLPGYGMLGTYGTLGVDAGLSYEQQFTIHFTVFQRESAPEDYTRLPE